MLPTPLTDTPLTDAERLTEVEACCINYANKLNRAGDRIAELKRDRAALIALVQAAYDDPDSEILGEEWNDKARATLAKVQP